MPLSYSENFDALVALTTHLGSTPRKSRRAPSLARDLGFPIETVRTVLDGFPAVIRKSRLADSKGEHFYTLHLRYARRGMKPEDEGQGEQDSANEPLRPEELASLLDLILKMVAHEREAERLSMGHQYQMSELREELKQRDSSQRLTSRVTLIAAIIAALAAVTAAIINSSKSPASTKATTSGLSISRAASHLV